MASTIIKIEDLKRSTKNGDQFKTHTGETLKVVTADEVNVQLGMSYYSWKDLERHIRTKAIQKISK